ncbi:MAG: hypothetical protein ABFD07_17830 [Methanobacterium sp.]
MIQNVTFTMDSTGTGILWLFLLTILASFMVSHFKCKNYNCSIKYSLLISIAAAIIYSIVFIFRMPQFPAEMQNSPLFGLILAIALLIFAIIPNIILGVASSSFAVFLKTTPNSNGITNKEISKKLKKKRKTK